MPQSVDKTARLDTDIIVAEAAQHGVTTTARVALLIYQRQAVRVVTLQSGASVSLGRDGGVADIEVADDSLSRRHACFELRGKEAWLEDLGSTNGTRVNGQRIAEPLQVGPADTIVLGSVPVALHATPADTLAVGSLKTHDQFQQRLTEEVARARDQGGRLALLAVRAADQQLGQIAGWSARMASQLRVYDHAALYSDNVLEILLPDTDRSRADSVARQLIGEAAPSEPALSVGIALMPNHAGSGESLLALALEASSVTDSSEPIRYAPASERRELKRDQLVAPVVESEPMKQLYLTVDRLAQASIPVLVQGETGVGKEVVCRAIHERGSAAEQPLICVNCGAIPGQLVESTLFGHERGAFTGAAQKQIGVFEAARGGTVLLDEIGELPATAQVALLRVLETKRIARVGSTREIEVQVRVLASTHRDLEAMCREGDFRWDLFYRLNAMTLRVPPLRERAIEVAALARVFLAQACLSNGFALKGLTKEALNLLQRYRWPGNVRELRNAIERAVVIAESDTVDIDDLPEAVTRWSEAVVSPRASLRPPAQPASDDVPSAPDSEVPSPEDFKSRMHAYEGDLLLEALRAADWDRASAAELLGLPLRTMAHKMKSHGIKRQSYDRSAS